MRESTPSLIYDPKTGLVANYYYHRGARKLNRVAKADFIFTHPDAWPGREVLPEGSSPALRRGQREGDRLRERPMLRLVPGTQSNTVVVTVVPVQGLNAAVWC